MKTFIFTLFLALCGIVGVQAQNKHLDSLHEALKNTKGDVKTEVNILNELCRELSNSDPKKALSNGRNALTLAQSNQYTKGEAIALKNIGVVYQYQDRNFSTGRGHHLTGCVNAHLGAHLSVAWQIPAHCLSQVLTRTRHTH